MGLDPVHVLEFFNLDREVLFEEKETLCSFLTGNYMKFQHLSQETHFKLNERTKLRKLPEHELTASHEKLLQSVPL